VARVKSADERGPIGAWAYEARVEHDLSVEQVIEALPTRYHPATLRKVESGSAKPGRRMLRELALLYGSEPPGASASPPPDDLAASIRELAEAIRQERAERVEWERSVVEVVRELAQALSQRDDPEPVPPASARH
jgi:hypothetical protein